MSKKNSITVCSGIEWNAMLGLLVQLERDKKTFPQILIASGCFLGLRANDLLSLKWLDVLDKEELVIQESKTQKLRRITLNNHLQQLYTKHKESLLVKGKFHPDNYIFSNRKGNRVSIQYANRLLKSIFEKYKVKTQNPSTHTLRKTFGKRVWEMDGKSERSLIYLSQIFNHSSTSITRRYIGITDETIKNVYLSL